MTKKILTTILAIGLLITSFSSGYLLSRSTLYPETGIITDVTQTDTGTYEIIFETSNGNIFSFYTDDCDLYVGDLISILMDNNGTEIVYNDTIIDHKYSGTPDMYK